MPQPELAASLVEWDFFGVKFRYEHLSKNIHLFHPVLTTNKQVNLVQNSVAAGMDLASIAPRWIDVKRGSLIMCVVGYLINPWRFVNSPGTFITVLNSFGMFVSPLAGINAVDL
jgi:cytosine/uracil/thiamine/allantoin permease